LQALQAATNGAAERLQIDDESGALRPGMGADLIAGSGDPVTDVAVLERVGFVLRAGPVDRGD